VSSIIDVSNIVFLRGERRILDNVTWRVEPNRHWALLGANGSGKTTLLKIITGYEWPTAGTVTVLGETFGQCNLPLLRKRIGYVSSAIEHTVPPIDTAADVVASGIDASVGVYREFSQAERSRCLACLSAMGVERFADQRYGLLSQGEKQRVLIARALVAGPGLMILDEPCVGLDPLAREQFLDDLATLAARPDAPTMIFVTHHIDEIRPWITDVAVLKNGRMLATGIVAEILTDRVLGDAFACRCDVRQVGPRYYLELHGSAADTTA
jgi:iron complex transport system ATP-binding protein